MRASLRLGLAGLLWTGLVGPAGPSASACAPQDPPTVQDGAAAQDAPTPRVRTELVAPDPLFVGQRATLVVELLAPGTFASAASWDLPDPSGVLLLPPGGHPVVRSEALDGVEYTVQRHELDLFAVRPGPATVPAFEVRFRYKLHPLDEDELVARPTTEPADLTAAAPPGAEGLGLVLAARDLTVREAWDPEPGDAPVPAGAAFRRTVTFTAPDLPGMLFPTFPTPELDGVRTYVEHALRDRADRGTRTGERRDVLTYVCQRPGTVRLPAARFTWYDLDARRLRTVTLHARDLTVVENPDLAAAGEADAGAGRGPFPWRGLAAAAGGLLALGLGWRLRGPLARVARELAAPLRPVHLEPLAPGRSARKGSRAGARARRRTRS